MQKKTKIALLSCLIILIIESTATSLIFSFNNKDGGAWPFVLCVLGFMNVVYSGLLIFMVSKRPVKPLATIIHSAALAITLFLIQNFYFIFNEMLFKPDLNQPQRMIKIFAQSEFSAPFIYITFLVLHLLIPTEKPR